MNWREAHEAHDQHRVAKYVANMFTVVLPVLAVGLYGARFTVPPVYSEFVKDMAASILHSTTGFGVIMTGDVALQLQVGVLFW